MIITINNIRIDYNIIMAIKKKKKRKINLKLNLTIKRKTRQTLLKMHLYIILYNNI